MSANNCPAEEHATILVGAYEGNAQKSASRSGISFWPRSIVVIILKSVMVKM